MIGRVLSKTEEPKFDEVWLFDTLLNNEKTKLHLKNGSFYVIDFNMEFEKDRSNPHFAEIYNSPIAKFFNTDNNCTTGFMKLGDLETGSIVTANFKTMPYSSNSFQYSDPFLVYDLSVEMNYKGTIQTVQIVNPEDVLASKKIFVPLF